MVAGVVVVASCGGGSSAPTSPARRSSGQGAPYLTVLVSSQLGVGENRVLVSLLNPDNTVAASPELAVKLAFFDLKASGDTPAFPTDATFAYSIPNERGIYISKVNFAKAGNWAVQVTTIRAGQGPVVLPPVTFDVLPKTDFPSIGQPAVASKTPTAAEVGGDLSRISTDPQPDASLYQTSVADAIAAHKPFVLVFSTPKFCTSSVCGPTLDRVKEARAQFPGVTVIHVEVVDPKDPIDKATGNIKPVKAVDEWRLPTEPWVFVVDSQGKVAGAFEGVITPDELVEAVRKVGA